MQRPGLDWTNIVFLSAAHLLALAAIAYLVWVRCSALTLVLGGVLPEFRVPFWVILICSLTMGVGTAIGGWRIVKTMGLRLTKLDPVRGFSAETAAASAIELASRLGIPLSTTHTINTSIMGVGSTHRFSAVRWGVGRQIVIAWILTFPVCGLLAWAIARGLSLLR